MRTRFDIDAGVLQAAKEIVANRRTTTAKVITERARNTLRPTRAAKVRNGVPLLPCRSPGRARATMALVNRLRDQE